MGFTLQGVVGSCLQFLDNVPGKVVFDFPVTRDGLTGACPRILIPIMTSTMAYENTPALFKLANEIDSLHAN